MQWENYFNKIVKTPQCIYLYTRYYKFSTHKNQISRPINERPLFWGEDRTLSLKHLRNILHGSPSSIALSWSRRWRSEAACGGHLIFLLANVRPDERKLYTDTRTFARENSRPWSGYIWVSQRTRLAHAAVLVAAGRDGFLPTCFSFAASPIVSPEHTALRSHHVISGSELSHTTSRSWAVH